MKDRGMMLATALAFAFVVAACIGSAVTSSHMSQTAAMHDSSSGGKHEKQPNLVQDQPAPKPLPETTGSAVSGR